MGLRTYFLGDTSAMARLGRPAVRARLMPLLEAGLIARCAVTDLEAGVSARSGPGWLRTRAIRALWPEAAVDESVVHRALEVQGELADRGLHRAVRIGDLIIAGAAERAGLVVLHYDRDFDRIAEVTGQSVDWVVPPGGAD